MADFGFVGPSYEAPSIYQDAQECINFYPEIDPLKQGQRGVIALYPTPGYTLANQLAYGEVRGMRALSGGQWAIIVSGSRVYSLNLTGVATQVGTLTTSSGYVSITDNQTTNNGLTAYIVDGPNRYTWTAATNTFAKLPTTDGPWTGATVCDVVDNYYVYNEPNSQNWAVSNLGLSTSPAQYGSKDGSPDNLVSIIVDHRQVYLLGENTTEVWVDVGSQIPGIATFPFQRISGTTMQHGIAAPFSVGRFSESFMFVSKDTRGQAIVGLMNGYQLARVSTHAVENTLVGVDISDAVAYTYQVEGHEFYVVTFPQADITWVYDLATQMWHKWLSVDNFNNFHRHRSNCAMFFNNQHYIGDYENGKVYVLDRNVYTEDGNKIRRLRRCPHLTSDLQRQYFSELQIQFQPGVGLQTGQGYDPQAMLRWSNDGGSTWSNEHWTSVGKVGRYQNRAIWRRLGWSRDRIYEVAVSDPVNFVIISANLKGEGGEN